MVDLQVAVVVMLVIVSAAAIYFVAMVPLQAKLRNHFGSGPEGLRTPGPNPIRQSDSLTAWVQHGSNAGLRRTRPNLMHEKFNTRTDGDSLSTSSRDASDHDEQVEDACETLMARRQIFSFVGQKRQARAPEEVEGAEAAACRPARRGRLTSIDSVTMVAESESRLREKMQTIISRFIRAGKFEKLHQELLSCQQMVAEEQKKFPGHLDALAEQMGSTIAGLEVRLTAHEVHAVSAEDLQECGRLLNIGSVPAEDVQTVWEKIYAAKESLTKMVGFVEGYQASVFNLGRKPGAEEGGVIEVVGNAVTQDSAGRHVFDEADPRTREMLECLGEAVVDGCVDRFCKADTQSREREAEKAARDAVVSVTATDEHADEVVETMKLEAWRLTAGEEAFSLSEALMLAKEHIESVSTELMTQLEQEFEDQIPEYHTRISPSGSTSRKAKKRGSFRGGGSFCDQDRAVLARMRAGLLPVIHDGQEPGSRVGSEAPRSTDRSRSTTRVLLGLRAQDLQGTQAPARQVSGTADNELDLDVELKKDDLVAEPAPYREDKQEQEQEHEHEQEGEDPPPTNPNAQLEHALWSLRRLLRLQWGSLSEAGRVLSTCGGEVGGDSRVAVRTLCERLRHRDGAERLEMGVEEVCVLFQAIGLPCSSDTSTLSPGELNRLAAYDRFLPERDVRKTVEDLLTALVLRRALLGSLSAAERLLARVYVEWEVAPHRDVPSAEPFMEALQGLLHALHPQHSSSAQVAEVAITTQALGVLVGILTASEASPDIKALAAQVLTRAIMRHGRILTWPWPAPHADPSSGRRLLQQATKPHVPSAATTPRPPRPPRTPTARTPTPAGRASSLSGGSTPAPTPPPASEPAHTTYAGPPDLTACLALDLWRPLLGFLDPDEDQRAARRIRLRTGQTMAAPPPRVCPRLFSAILELLWRARVPAMLLGPHGARLAPSVICGLQQLNSSEVSSLERAVASFQALEQSHLAVDGRRGGGAAAEVQALAAALGGCRFLREQLARQAGSEPDLCERAERMLRAWRRERQKLRMRWPKSPKRPCGMRRLEALARAVRCCELLGDFEVDWAGLDSPTAPTPEPPRATLSVSADALLQTPGMDGSRHRPRAGDGEAPGHEDPLDLYRADSCFSESEWANHLSQFPEDGLASRVVQRLAAHWQQDRPGEYLDGFASVDSAADGRQPWPPSQDRSSTWNAPEVSRTEGRSGGAGKSLTWDDPISTSRGPGRTGPKLGLGDVLPWTVADSAPPRSARSASGASRGARSATPSAGGSMSARGTAKEPWAVAVGRLPAVAMGRTR